MANVTLTLSFNSVDEAQAFLAGHPQAAVIRVDERTPFEKLMDELEDPRFNLRSFSELITQTNIPSRNEIESLLRGNDVDYVVKTRQRDRAALVGLADRN